MITKFKIFEELKIGYNVSEGVYGSFIRKRQDNNSCRKIISSIIQFLKQQNIEYYLFYKPETGDDMFEFLFPNMEKDEIKFPKNKFNENKPYLPAPRNNWYEIGLLFKDDIDGWTDITEMEDINDVEPILKVNKYNL